MVFNSHGKYDYCYQYFFQSTKKIMLQYRHLKLDSGISDSVDTLGRS